MINNHIVFNPIFDWRFKLSKAEGSFLWDDKGRRIIDFTSGWNTANLGWNHPEIKEAIAKQLEKNTYIPSWVSDPVQEEYAQNLVSELPPTLNTVCRVTSGTEANEQAIKIARVATKRKKIIGFYETYHGSTYGSLSIGYRPEYLTDVDPMVGEFVHLDFPEISDPEIFLGNLEKLLIKKDVAAFILESGIITGWGSMKIAPAGILKPIRDLTRKYGTFLIIDEVGTGFSRLGSLFAIQAEKIVPDIVTFAKAMTNGTSAMGACVTNSDVIKDIISRAKVLSSLGWMPLGCAAAIKVLEIHKRDRVWEMAKTNGEWMVNELKNKLPKSVVSEVRGRGMEIGIDFTKNTKDNSHVGLVENIVNNSFKNGLQILQSDEATLQIMPPLNTPRNTIAEGIDIMVDAAKTALNQI
jgi:acetylornithine/succinyldiaminopimelate/putrescine aminotransferase